MQPEPHHHPLTPPGSDIPGMDDFIETNRGLWNQWTPLHERSAFYDVEAFKAGRSSLNALELSELGPVEGRSLLHLQCHFGQDTLSWARLGARVTGVDLSDEAITLARRLAGELGIEARFLRANVYDLPALLDERFDIVYTSYGVLPWLPDIRRWAEVVARHLRPGGTFYLVEFHPAATMLDPTGTRVVYPYASPEPLPIEEQGSYADPSAPVRHLSYQWAHSLGDVVTALVDAGLRLEFLRENAYSSYGVFAFAREAAPGVWRAAPGAAQVPLMFSVRAVREAPGGAP